MFRFIAKAVTGKLTWIIAGSLLAAGTYGITWVIKKKAPELKYSLKVKKDGEKIGRLL